MSIVVSPTQMAMLEHVAFDGDHPSDASDGTRWRRRCEVCSGEKERFTGDLDPYAAMAYPDSPAARRVEARRHEMGPR